MKKNNSIYRKAIFVLLGAFFFLGCSEINQDFNPGGLSIGFTLDEYSYPTFFEGADEAALPLQFFANVAPSQSVTLNYTITSSTGAQAGVQYHDPNNGSITIGPGEGRYFTLDLVLLAAGYTGENDGRQDEYEVTFASSDSYVIDAIGNVSTKASVFAQCVFSAEEFTGTAHIEDGFGDVSSYDITISAENENTLRITGFHPTTPGTVTNYTWTFSVNTQTGVVTVPYQIYTTDDLYDLGYTNWAVQGSGNFDICNRVLTLRLTNTVDAGSYGAANYTITWP